MVRTRRTGRGMEIVEIPPTHCPNGHPLRPPNVQVCWEQGPDGRMCRAWRCWTCGVVTYDAEPDSP